MQQNASIHGIYIVCGYDLIFWALQEILTRENYQIHLTSLEDILNIYDFSVELLVFDDAAIPATDFEQTLAVLVKNLPDTHFIIIDSHIRPQRIFYAIELGISSYLYLGDKLSTRLKQAVEDVMQGGTYYSPSIIEALTSARQIAGKTLPRINDYHRQILQGMAAHQSAGEIGRSLGRSAQAIYQVQSYLRGMFNVDTNSELLEIAEKWGVIQRQT